MDAAVGRGRHRAQPLYGEGPEPRGSFSSSAAEKSPNPRHSNKFPQMWNGESGTEEDFPQAVELFPTGDQSAGPLHCAILRQLHHLSPTALSTVQLATLLRGRGYLLLQRDLARAVEELVERAQLERFMSIDGRASYRLRERPWSDGGQEEP
ncbi:MAG: hypothetical protein LBB14_03380 [Puniceicoccales bacterium]|nr:hypothetical protein [Puniceicoccales bacterium]